MNRVICDSCKREILLTPDTIKEAAVKIDGQDFTLVYFACPECSRIYRIILKDGRYEELRSDLEKIKKRIRKNHGSNNDELAETLNDMVFKKLNRLRDYVDMLNAKFPGTFTFVVSENNHEGKSIKYLP